MFESGLQSNTAAGAPPLDPVRLRASAPLRTLRGRNVSKADVFFYRLDDLALVVKDYGRRPFLVRHTAGRFFTSREAAAYRAAAGIAGLPEFLGRLGPCALAVRWIDGVPLAALDPQALPPGFFDRVGSILAALHERGIALADLHHRDVLLGPGGSAFIVDLATAWIAGERAGRLRRAIFRRLADLDRVALARLRARFSGEQEGPAVVAAAGRSAWLYRGGRRLKSLWDLLRGKRSRALSSRRGKSE